MTPIEAQMKSWNGKIFARPELTIAVRATIAPMIPMRAQNIHPGKKAPNRVNDGAPLRSDLPYTSAGLAPKMTAMPQADVARPI